jgi:hypothetical protein
MTWGRVRRVHRVELMFFFWGDGEVFDYDYAESGVGRFGSSVGVTGECPEVSSTELSNRGRADNFPNFLMYY